MIRFTNALAVLLLGLLAVVAFGGCNTIHGMGEDVEEGGEEIQDAAE